MKNKTEENCNTDLLLTILFFVFLGFCAGIFYNSSYSLPLRTFIHDIYVKINPDVQKTSREIIMDNVTKNNAYVSESSIFDEPDKKENKIILFVKKFFMKKKDAPATINNYDLN